MTSRLTWREASRGDRSALSCFICTPPQRRSAFGRSAPVPLEWELQVQGYVRALRPPASPGQLILLGEDDQGLGAVAWTAEVDGPHDVFVKVLAVALRLRGQGYAQELLDEVVDRVANRADAAGADRVTLSGNVHVNNAASRRFCERAGAGVFQGHGELDEWVLPVDLR